MPIHFSTMAVRDPTIPCCLVTCEMADTEVVSSNAIFEVLEDWNTQLSHTDFASSCEEWEDEIEGPQP